MLDLKPFSVLTFDCYGTMINWEHGIFSVLRPILAAHNKAISDAALLELYSELELQEEQGKYRKYRDILQSVVSGFGSRLGFNPSEQEVQSLPESVPQWPPFADTVAALKRLQRRYRLAVISNIDDDLFASSAPKLQVRFEQVITAEQARSYKPSLNNFRIALDRLKVSPDRLLHVGQSLYHDVAPAQSLGIKTVWVNRPSPRPGAGAAKNADVRPDLEVNDLATLADIALQEQPDPLAKRTALRS